MSSLIFIIIIFFVCFIAHLLFILYIPRKTELKFFLCWLGLCIVFYFVFSFGASLYAFFVYGLIFAGDFNKTSSSTNATKSCNANDLHLYDRVYEDNTRRIKNLSGTGYIYSNGMESWRGMSGEEHRSNGEVVYDNAYVSEKRNIYDENGTYVGSEYEDIIGQTKRVNR